MSTLSPQQARLQDDLRGVLDGDVRCDEVTLQLFSTDAGLYEQKPLGVIWPRSAKDVAQVVRYASEKGISVHPRGSGTNTVGGAIGNGLILDFSRYMRRTIHVDENSVCVQPGAIRERVNDILRRTKRHFFAPSAGHLPTSTIGSILSVDMLGPRWLRYGFPHEHVLELQIVTPDGQIRNLKPVSPGELNTEQLTQTSPFWGPVISLLQKNQKAISTEQSATLPYRPGYRLEGVLQKNRFDPARLICGSEGTLGIITEARLATTALAEASGAVIFLFDTLEKAMKSVPAILKYQPTLCDLIDRRIINRIRDWDRRFLTILPNNTEVALVVELDRDSFSDLNNDLHDLAQQVRDKNDLAFGYWFALHHEEKELFRDLLRKCETVLLRIAIPFRIVPLWGDIQVPIEALSDFLSAAQNILKRSNQTYSVSGHIGQGQLRIQLILPGTEDCQETILRLKEDIQTEVLRYNGGFGSARGFGIEGTAILPKRFPLLTPIFVQIKNLIDPKNLFCPNRIVTPEMRAVSRFLTGEPPENYSLPEKDQTERKTDEQIPTEKKTGKKNLFEKISIEEKSPEKTGGETLPLPTLRTMVHQNASVASENPEPADKLFSFDSLNEKPLRPVPPPPRLNKKQKPENKAESGNRDVTGPPPQSQSQSQSQSQLRLQLRWNDSLIVPEALRCTGCGQCRIRTTEVRMCPSFRHTPEEQASCRAKANLIRGIFDKHLDLESLTEDDVLKIADFCIFCHTCQRECPSQTDIPRLAFRIKSAYYSAHGLPVSDRILSNCDLLLKLMSPLAPVSNKLLSNRSVRWFLEKTLGIAQGRKIPKLSRRSFLSQIARNKRISRPGRQRDPKVALFVDSYANYFDQKLAYAALKVLEHNGIDVFIPCRQKSSGHPAFVTGNITQAESIAFHNWGLLNEAVRQGYQIVTLEPCSATCLKYEYPFLQLDADVQSVANHTTDICTYLYQYHQMGKLQLDFTPMSLTVGYHAPCRTLALTGDSLAMATPAQELLNLIPGISVERLERGCCGYASALGIKKENCAMSLRLGMRLFLALRESDIQAGATECSFCKMQMEQGSNKQTFHPIMLLASAYGLI